MNLIIQTVFNVPDEAETQEAFQMIAEALNQFINENDGLGEDTRLYGMELMTVLNENEGKKIFMYNASGVSEETYHNICDKPDEDTAVHIIRVAVEGVENHHKRFDIMDQIIGEMGASPDDEHLNVFFVFDTGPIDRFCKWVVPFLLQPNPDILQKAKEEGITFCQWFSRTEREDQLRKIRDQIREMG